MPHFEDITGVGNELERPVHAIEDVEDGEALIFVFGNKLELLSVAPRV